jgi:hypothetical protein
MSLFSYAYQSLGHSWVCLFSCMLSEILIWQRDFLRIPASTFANRSKNADYNEGKFTMGLLKENSRLLLWLPPKLLGGIGGKCETIHINQDLCPTGRRFLSTYSQSMCFLLCVLCWPCRLIQKALGHFCSAIPPIMYFLSVAEISHVWDWTLPLLFLFSKMIDKMTYYIW